MRKAFFALIFLLSFHFLSAQQFRFGLTASPEFNFTRILASNISSGGVSVGLNYGLLVDFTLGEVERYAFSTGITHRMANVTFENITRLDGAISYTATQKLKLQYVEIPLTLRLRTNEVGYITYYGQMGFVPGLLIASRYDQKADNPDDAYNFKNRKNETSKLFNLSLHVGAGIEYSLGGATAVMAGLYYNNGFTDISRASYFNDKISLRNIGLRLGILF